MGRDGLIHIETITSSESSEESVEMMMLNGDEDRIHIQEEEKHDTSLESYLFLRVLLVEADDSSRMIISALLRKCGYRVAAVADGLKAWEILKERPKEIDLVLTEIELPSVPGSSLLTMIMGDAICRQIPVIMMSAQDSVNLVFNCMLGGAADFLVKPIRKNELKNLWQHVWRRQSLQNNGKSSSPNASTVQQKVEAIDDNCLTKCSSDSMAPPPKRRKGSSDKGSDAQSSCTKPETEAESANIQTIGNNSSESNPKGKLSGGRLPNHKEFVDLETHTEDVTIYDETIEDNDEHFEPCREAMDLIGSLDHRHTYNLNDATNKNGYTSPLELSLRITDEITQKNTLNHSSGSAFSWYANSTLEPPFVASVDFCTEAKQHAHIIDQVPFQNGGKLNNNYVTPLDGDQVVEVVKAAFSGSGIISVPIPVRGIQCDKFQPLFNTSLTANRQEAIPVDSTEELNHVGCSLVQNAIKMINPTMHGQLPKKMESSENQSGTSSLCNSALSHLNSTECRSDCNESNGNVTPGPIFSGNDKGVLSQEGTRGIDSTNCFNPREAALNKFRLKRKDRCFEKKVRYQSRQRLAEQRPRVKGQFVRQMPL